MKASDWINDWFASSESKALEEVSAYEEALSPLGLEAPEVKTSEDGLPFRKDHPVTLEYKGRQIRLQYI
jgi:hypothetical protein